MDTSWDEVRAALASKERDIDGDGIADFIQPPPAFVFWAQELLPALLLLTRHPRVQRLPLLFLAGLHVHFSSCLGRRY